MPEPFAIPAILTNLPPISTSAEAPLAKVSVVIIACAASSMPSTDRPADSSATFAVIRSCGSRSPMTPVDEVKTRSADKPVSAATASQIAATEFSPARPVKAFELPELMIKAAPLSLSIPTFAWQSNTFADRVDDLVNVPATVLPGDNRIRVTSLRPSYFIPAATAANSTP